MLNYGAGTNVVKRDCGVEVGVQVAKRSVKLALIMMFRELVA